MNGYASIPWHVQKKDNVATEVFWWAITQILRSVSSDHVHTFSKWRISLFCFKTNKKRAKFKRRKRTVFAEFGNYILILWPLALSHVWHKTFWKHQSNNLPSFEDQNCPPAFVCDSGHEWILEPRSFRCRLKSMCNRWNIESFLVHFYNVVTKWSIIPWVYFVKVWVLLASFLRSLATSPLTC